MNSQVSAGEDICCWWGRRWGFNSLVRWGIVLTAPFYPTPLGSGVQVRWTNVLWCLHTAVKQKSSKIWNVRLAEGKGWTKKLRFNDLCRCARQSGIHKHALCSPPPASCFWAYEISITHLSVSRINISPLLKFACTRQIPLPWDLNIPSGITCNLLSFYIHCSTLMGI